MLFAEAPKLLCREPDSVVAVRKTIEFLVFDRIGVREEDRKDNLSAACDDGLELFQDALQFVDINVGEDAPEDDDGRLLGIFTDSDLARLFERRREADLDRPIGEVMTPDPVQILAGSSVGEAVEAMKARKISELPVVDRGGHPVGLIDLTDLIGLVPAEAEE